MKSALHTILFLLIWTAQGTLAARDSVKDAINQGDAKALAAALQAQGDDFKVSAQMMQQICDKPELIDVVLRYLYNDLPAAKTTVVPTPATPATSSSAEAVPQPRAELRRDPAFLAGDRIMVALDTLSRASRFEDEPSAYGQRIDAQNGLLRTIFDPENIMGREAYVARYGSENLPDWAGELLDVALAGKTRGMPALQFQVDKGINYALTARDLGVKISISLFMVHHKPDDVEDFNLRTALMGSHEKYAMTYDPEKNDFEMTLIGKPGRNMLRLYKELGKEEVKLYPGTWGFRLRFTTGRNQLRADQVHYFDVEAGQNYKLVLDKTKGAKVKIDVVER